MSLLRELITNLFVIDCTRYWQVIKEKQINNTETAASQGTKQTLNQILPKKWHCRRIVILCSYVLWIRFLSKYKFLSKQKVNVAVEVVHTKNSNRIMLSYSVKQGYLKYKNIFFYLFIVTKFKEQIGKLQWNIEIIWYTVKKLIHIVNKHRCVGENKSQWLHIGVIPYVIKFKVNFSENMLCCLVPTSCVWPTTCTSLSLFWYIYRKFCLFSVLENPLVGSFSGCRNTFLLCAEVEILH